MDRRAKILGSITPAMQVLELGPGYSPIAPKSKGWNTCTVDHAHRDELVSKYSSEPDVDASQIEEVDVVWNTGALHEAVPVESHGTFDACIGSHVLEHIPDPIGLFTSLDRLLKPNGVISLAIPDKRFCFDFFKPLTSTGELLDAHRRGARRHTLKSVFDGAAYNVSSAGQICWGPRRASDVRFLSPFDEAKLTYDRFGGTADDPYVDAHAWCFTPSSFELAMLELGALGEIDFSAERSAPPEGCEFYVTLTHSHSPIVGGDELQRKRLELLTETMREVGEQTDFLLDGLATGRRPTATAPRLVSLTILAREKIRATARRAPGRRRPR